MFVRKSEDQQGIELTHFVADSEMAFHFRFVELCSLNDEVLCCSSHAFSLRGVNALPKDNAPGRKSNQIDHTSILPHDAIDETCAKILEYLDS